MRFLRQILLSLMVGLGGTAFGQIAILDFGGTPEDTQVTFNITDNDIDLDGTIDPSTVDLDPGSPGRQETLSNDDGEYSVDGAGNLTYLPALNLTGSVSISYVVNDNDGNTSIFPASVTISVSAVNDAPVIKEQVALDVDEDGSITVKFQDLTVDDPDDNYPGGFGMTLTDGDDYDVSGRTVTPNPDFFGTLHIPTTVDDGNAESAPFDLVITVNAVNDRPVINSQKPLAINEDNSITVLLTDLIVSDPDNSYPGTFTMTLGNGPDYTVDGAIVTPDEDFAGTLHVPVTVNDGNLSSTPAFSLTITVNPLNDVPVITDQKPLSTNEDTPITVVLTDLTVDDPDNNYPGTFLMVLGAGANYVVSGNMITPSLNFSGTLTVPTTVNDGNAVSASFPLIITVGPVNDAPVINNQKPLSTNEDTPITVVLTDLLVTDPDNTYPGTFTMTLAPGANYSVLGATITPNSNFIGTLSVSTTVYDGSLTSAPFSLQIAVNTVNDVPIITGQSPNPLTVVEDNSITLTVSNLTITDPDDTYPGGFTLAATGGANYTLLGNTVTPALNFNGTLSVPVTVNDGDAISNTFAVQINVTSVNDGPVITNQKPLSTNEDTPIVIALSDLIVTDPDNTYPGTFTMTHAGGANYSVSGHTITPNANFIGTLSVSTTVNDGSLTSAPFNLQITVNGVNDIPVITGQSPNPLTVVEDNSITLTVSNLTITDPDDTYPGGFTLSATGGANYTLVGNTVTPTLNYNGILSVPVTVNDGNDNSNIYNVQINVTPVNDVPQITGQQPLSTGENQPIALSLSQLFVFDPDDNFPADFELLVTSGANYSVSGNIVTPSPGFSGVILVKVFVNDGTAISPIYNLQIQVNSVNDPPVITGQQPLSMTEDGSLTIQTANLIVSDPDNTYPNGFTLTVLPGTNYNAAINTVTPTLNFNGTLTVNVKVNDGLADSAPFPLQVNVTPVNDAPVITGQQPLDTNEDTPLTILFSNLLVTDPDNTYSTGFSMSLTSGTNYTVSGSVVTPAANFSGTISVPVRVNDGNANSNTFTLTITVNPLNDAPVITGQQPITTAEETAYLVKLADLIVSDPDHTYPTGFSLSVASGTNYTVSGNTITPALNFNGTLTVNVTVRDPANAVSASFPLQVQVSPVNSIPVITGQQALSTPEEQPITLALNNLLVTDPDNTYPIGFTLSAAAGANYLLSGNTVTPALNFNGTLTVPVRVNDGVNTSAPFNLSITVTPVNDAPVITAQTNPNLAIAEDASLTVAFSHLTVTDPDNNYPTGFSLTVAGGTNYTFVNNTITPVQNFSGNLSVNVTVNDGAAASANFQLIVKVNGVNDPPKSSGLPTSVIDEDNASEIVVNLLNGFSDAEDNASLLTYQIIGNDNPSFFSSISIDQSAGQLKYKVKPNVFGTAKITIRATDTGNLSVQDVLTITINPINDAPSFDAVADRTVIENSPGASITLLNVSKGPFENAQNLTIFATSGNTSVIPDPVITYDGTSAQAQLTYTILPNKSGLVTINIFANDDGSNTLPNRNSFTSSFTIEVVEVNNQPTLNTLTNLTILEDAAQQTVNLTGISAGAGETDQVITVTASVPESKKALFENGDTNPFEINYTSPEATGTLRFKPKANASGTAQVTVTVTDNGANAPAPNVNFISRTFNVVITPVNDLPVFVSTPVLNATVGLPYEYIVEVTDVENDVIALTLPVKPAWLAITAISNGKARISGTPPANASGNVNIRMQAKDPTGTPVSQEYVIVVNTRPTVTSFVVTTDEDVNVNFQQQQFTAAYSDVENDAMTTLKIVKLPNPDKGTLVLGGVPVTAGQEIALIAISTLQYQPRRDSSGVVDTLYWSASDGAQYASPDAMVRIIINPVNDAPEITVLETIPFRYEVGQGPIILTPAFTVVDADKDSIMSAEIGFRIQNYKEDDDILVFTNTDKIKGTFNSSAGVLSLTGKASTAEYSAAIRTITYEYEPISLPGDTVKLVYFSLTDGKAFSETKDRKVHLKYTFEEVPIVNGFTPNGDEVNDTWKPIDAERTGEFPNAEFKVYDKRGKLLFQAIGFEKEWDGKFNGDVLPADSYFYTIDLKLTIKKVYRGVVTILR